MLRLWLPMPWQRVWQRLHMASKLKTFVPHWQPSRLRWVKLPDGWTCSIWAISMRWWTMPTTPIATRHWADLSKIGRLNVSVWLEVRAIAAMRTLWLWVSSQRKCSIELSSKKMTTHEDAPEVRPQLWSWKGFRKANARFLIKPSWMRRRRSIPYWIQLRRVDWLWSCQKVSAGRSV